LVHWAGQGKALNIGQTEGQKMTRQELISRINEEQKYDQDYVDLMKKRWGADLEQLDGRTMVDVLSYLLGRKLSQHTRTQAGA